MSAEVLVLTRPAEPDERPSAFPCIVLPLLRISSQPLTPELQQQLRQASSADVQIFLSQHAVRATAALEPRLGRAGARWFAVGAATARAVADSFSVGCDTPEVGSTDSEGLLQLLGAVAGQRVSVYTAPEGRDLLVSSLRARGAEVEVIEVYRRERLNPTAEQLAVLRQETRPLLFSATSVAVLDALLAVLAELGLEPRQVAVVVASARIAAVARERGFVDVRNAASADGMALARCLR